MVRKKFSLVSLLKKAIKMFLNTLYITFVIAFSFGTLIAGILTILPAEASKASYLGYYSTCSFAPFSTIILFSLAFIGFILLMKLRKYFVTKSRKQLVYLENETLIKQN
jgi:hypothetical protein